MRKWILILLMCLLPFSLYADWSADGVTDEYSSDGVVRPISDDTVTCTYFDSFPSAISSTYWTETDTNTELDVVSGELNFNSSGTAQSIGLLVSKWTFNADTDFDIRVDFNGISWTAGDSADYLNSVAVEIKSGAIWVNLGRSITDADVEQYQYKGSTSVRTGIAGSATSGRLRISYNGTTGRATLYYWDEGQSQWEWNDATAGVSPVEDFSGEAIQVQLFFVRREATGGNTYNVDLDNLRIINGCENITLP